MNDRFCPPQLPCDTPLALREAFFDEAADHLERFEQLLLQLELDGTGDDTAHALFRCAHSVKGGAAAFGLDDVSALTHQLEALLDRVRRGERAADAPLLELLLQGADAVRALLAQHRGASGAATGAASGAATGAATGAASERHDLRELLVALRQASATAAAPEPAAAERERLLTVGPLHDRDALEALVASFAEIDGLGRIEPLDASEAHRDDGMHRFVLHSGCSDEELLALCGFHVDVALLQLAPRSAPAAAEAAPAGSAPAPDAAAPTPARASPAPAGGESLRVPVRKVDELINLAGELVTAEAMLAQGCAALAPAEQLRLAAVLAELQRHTRALQDAAMAIRMLPVATLFGRFPRMVRELGAKTGKPLRLLIEGDTTELDKGMIEKITDPLTHLVRNSCDHGIEPPQERRACGKPEAGTLRLRAAQHGSSIVIELRDDGRGLSRERLLASARQRGLHAPDALGDAEVWQLIFAPGFSTAAQLSDVSGRGVGMDVVKRTVGALGGTVELDNLEGRGLGVRLRLPLTLAILDGMVVRIAGERYVLPLAAVLESFQLAPERLASVGGRAEMVRWRDEFLPVLALQQLLAVPDADADAAAVRDDAILVVVQAGSTRAALRVHELLGQQPVVVKNLETHLGAVERLAGATILADGRVAPILDVASLLRALPR